MDFKELENESHNKNVKKNRATLVALFVIFFTPVLIAYSAYFTGWFNKGTQNKGELLVDGDILDIEDFKLVKNGKPISGEEFETLYWWIMPIDNNGCNRDCLELNVYMLNQTYQGLGKEANRINPLVILANGESPIDDKFPTAHSEFSSVGVKALENTRSGFNKDLPSNYIYLVDPLGNIFMRYELARDKGQAPEISKDMRTDVRRLFKFSRLG
ncbi:MAG: hypothetical protein OQJ89_15785 [Kangiellaceae bacterium]|nr:hypothetical protein [Kangiellaceae bacterium]MCW9018434.1 hypothetical protein [Kangiellaceae bacterium]